MRVVFLRVELPNDRFKPEEVAYFAKGPGLGLDDVATNVVVQGSYDEAEVPADGVEVSLLDDGSEDSMWRFGRGRMELEDIQESGADVALPDTVTEGLVVTRVEVTHPPIGSVRGARLCYGGGGAGVPWFDGAEGEPGRGSGGGGLRGRHIHQGAPLGEGVSHLCGWLAGVMGGG